MARGSFNQDLVSKLVSQSRAAAGYHAFLITEAEQHTPEAQDGKEPNNNLMWALTYRMLSDPNDADSVQGPAVREWLTLPLVNESVENHEPPPYATDTCCELMAAIFPEECVDVPRLRGDKRNKKLYYRGEEISRSEERQGRKEALALAGPKIVEIDEDVSQLVGHVFYGDLYYPKKNPNFPKIARKSGEPEQEISQEFMEYAADEGDAAPAKGGRSSTVKKSKSKSRSRR